MRYRDLVEDGHVPGLLVHPDWWEPKHPQEIPVEIDDPVALYRPAPEISIPAGYGQPDFGNDQPVDIFDEFDRASLGSNWVTPVLKDIVNPFRGTMEIGPTQGTIRPDSELNTPWKEAIYVAGDIGVDQYSQAVYILNNWVGSNEFDYTAGVYVRATAGGRQAVFGYISWSDTYGRYWEWGKMEDGATGIPTQASYFTGYGFDYDMTPWPSPITLRIEAEGSLFKFFIDGEMYAAHDDPEYKTGYPGIVTAVTILPEFDVNNVLVDRYEAGTTRGLRASGSIAQTLTGGETQVLLQEALKINSDYNWVYILLDDSSYHVTRIADFGDGPTFVLKFTTPFPEGKTASSGNAFSIRDKL
jgi:hypothetical protein